VIRKYCYGKNYGFTVAEIVVAIMLIGSALIPIFSMLIFGTKNTGKTSDIILATNLAVEKMELLKSEAFENIRSEGNDIIVGADKPILIKGYRNGKIYLYDSSERSNSGDPIITYPIEYSRFIRTVDVKQGSNKDIKTVSVIVRWYDKKTGKLVDNAVVLKTLIINEDEKF